MKRGQVSTFIIIAVIIVLVIILVFLFRNNLIMPEDSDLKLAESITFDCINEVSQDSLGTIGIQGGYYNEPDAYFDLNWTFIPFYYLEGELLMPENSVIENELAAYVDDNLGPCLDNAEIETVEITYTDPSTKSVIKPEEVSFTIDSVVTLKKGDKTKEINLADYPSNNPSALANILEAAKYLIDAHNEEMICVTCLYDLLAEKDLYLDIIEFTETSSLIVFSEDQMSKEPYAFEFLNKYSPGELGLEELETAGETIEGPEVEAEPGSAP